jgi:hypothetical protein
MVGNDIIEEAPVVITSTAATVETRATVGRASIT